MQKSGKQEGKRNLETQKLGAAIADWTVTNMLVKLILKIMSYFKNKIPEQNSVNHQHVMNAFYKRC